MDDRPRQLGRIGNGSMATMIVGLLLGCAAGILGLDGVAVAATSSRSPVVVVLRTPAPEPTTDPALPAAETDDRSAALVPVPPGCLVPDPADVAFIGTAVAKDFEKVRYEIVQLRAGTATGRAIDGLIDVLYLDDAKFLDVGQDYLVGARFDAEYGEMFSTVRPPEPLFGGNDVIGLEDTDVDCPVIDDPVRTLNPDGSSVDSGVFSPLLDDKRTVLATLGVPTALAFAAIIALVLVRFLWGFAVKGIFALGRSAVTPAPDHRAIQVRSHRRDSDG